MTATEDRGYSLWGHLIFFDMFHGQGSFFDTHEREGSIDLVVNATSLLNVPKTIFQSALAPYQYN